jgi:hypothetical protein
MPVVTSKLRDFRDDDRRIREVSMAGSFPEKYVPRR